MWLGQLNQGGFKRSVPERSGLLGILPGHFFGAVLFGPVLKGRTFRFLFGVPFEDPLFGWGCWTKFGRLSRVKRASAHGWSFLVVLFLERAVFVRPTTANQPTKLPFPCLDISRSFTSSKTSMDSSQGGRQTQEQPMCRGDALLAEQQRRSMQLVEGRVTSSKSPPGFHLLISIASILAMVASFREASPRHSRPFPTGAIHPCPSPPGRSHPFPSVAMLLSVGSPLFAQLHQDLDMENPFSGCCEVYPSWLFLFLLSLFLWDPLVDII